MSTVEEVRRYGPNGVRVYNCLARAGYVVGGIPLRWASPLPELDVMRVALASDEDLLTIPGLGAASLRHIRERWPVTEDWSI